MANYAKHSSCKKMGRGAFESSSSFSDLSVTCFIKLALSHHLVDFSRQSVKENFDVNQTFSVS